jgi:hypothetical protein
VDLSAAGSLVVSLSIVCESQLSSATPGREFDRQEAGKTSRKKFVDTNLMIPTGTREFQEESFDTGSFVSYRCFEVPDDAENLLSRIGTR